jgi:hypothetical protein
MDFSLHSAFSSKLSCGFGYIAPTQSKFFPSSVTNLLFKSVSGSRRTEISHICFHQPRCFIPSKDHAVWPFEEATSQNDNNPSNLFSIWDYSVNGEDFTWLNTVVPEKLEVLSLRKNDRLNSLISFKLRGTELQKVNEYCDAKGFSRSELMREFVQNIVAEKAPTEDTNPGDG